MDAMHAEILARNRDVIGQLRKSGTLHKTTENGESCLILATKLQDYQMVEQLLLAGAVLWSNSLENYLKIVHD